MVKKIQKKTVWAGSSKSFRRKDFLFIGLLIGLAWLVYGNVLPGPFIWDDLGLVRDNVYIKNWSYMKEIWTGHLWAGTADETVQSSRIAFFWRPLQVLSYAIDYRLWGMNALGYHVTNILWHAAVAVCLFVLCRLLFARPLVGMIAAALFVVHPAHTEAVSYISGRSDPMAAVFLLLGLIFFARIRTTRLGVFAVAGCYLAALLCRENSVIFPLLAAALYFLTPLNQKAQASCPGVKEFSSKGDPRVSSSSNGNAVAACPWWRRWNQPSAWIIFSALACVLISYVVARVMVVGHLFKGDGVAAPALGERAALIFAGLAGYGRILIRPVKLHMEYGMPAVGWEQVEPWIGVMIFMVIVVLIVTQRRRRPAVSFGLSWFLLGWAPISGIIPLNAYMAEHWMYFPSMGIFIAVANELDKFLARLSSSRWGLVPLSACVLVLGFLTFQQNILWRNPQLFYEAMIRLGVSSARVYNNLGAIYQEQKKPRQAQAMFERAFATDPAFEKSLLNLGNVYEESGDLEQAAAMYEKVIMMSPRYPPAYYNLANVFRRQGANERAVEYYQKALSLNPSYLQAYNNLGNTYKDLGRLAEAESVLRQVVERDPRYADAYNNLGVVLMLQNRLEESQQMLQWALQINPQFAAAVANLAVVSYSRGQIEEAVRLADQAQRLGAVLNPEFLKILGAYTKGR